MILESLQTHWSQLSDLVDETNSSVVSQTFLQWEAELYAAYNQTEPDEAELKALVARGHSLNLRLLVAVYSPERTDKLTGYGFYCFPSAREK